jgi:two-component system phosphate regulon response regulator PhoB
MSRASVLIVEDDSALAEVLAYNLRQAGFTVSQASNGSEGLRQARLTPPDLILLDLMLPLIDGIEVCRRLRAEPETRNVLVLMLTARAEESDQIVGLSMGADDYVTKPFSVKVLLERINALLRRREQDRPESEESVGVQGIVVDRRRHRVTAGQSPLPLTLSEFRILEMVIRQPGRVFSRTELVEAALNKDGAIMDRTIDVHIRSLRQKLGKYSHLIETVRGVGYRFRDQQA